MREIEALHFYCCRSASSSLVTLAATIYMEMSIGMVDCCQAIQVHQLQNSLLTSICKC
uniref:Uncharacterized protein n=1 Tax=Triticum urartu TaxID=4572 RepID=A0A8R7TXA1_TRIUA